MPRPLLSVENLTVEFRTDDGVVRAVNDVSFSLEPGKTLGLVGESGSGKSVTNLAMMGLIPTPPGRIVSGRAIFDARTEAPVDLLQLPTRDMRRFRGRRISMIFQDSMTALNPFLTVEEQLTETTRLHLGHDPATARKHAIEMLAKVGIPAPDKRIDDYPHQFSGGMRQRVMIAMALSCKPELLIADEPTTALDVTVQSQVLELIRDLQRSEGTAVILVTHSLGVVASMCDRVAVLYGGRIVEEAPVDQLFADPRHPYTLGLLESIPRVDVALSEKLKAIPGQPPNMIRPPTGCAFHPRCRFKTGKCETTSPPLVQLSAERAHACLIDVTQAETARVG